MRDTIGRAPMGRSLFASALAIAFLAVTGQMPASATERPIDWGTPAKCSPAFQLVQSKNPGPSNAILYGTTATSPSDVWAVGYFANATTFNALAEHFNGSRWHVTAAPNAGDRHNILSAVSADGPSDVWAVGNSLDVGVGAQSRTLIERWNGSKWSITPSPNVDGDDFLLGVVAVGPNDVWAVGSVATIGGIQPLALHWDGTGWSISDTDPAIGVGEFFGVAATGPNDVWAVGDQSGTGSRHTLIEHFDGAAWSVVSTRAPGTESSLAGVATIGAGSAYAVGSSTSSNETKSLVLQWDGTAWNDVPVPAPAGSQASLSSVAAGDAQDVWAVGSSVATSGATRTLVEHWGGRDWAIVSSRDPKPMRYNFFQGVAVIPGYGVWATGFYTGTGVDRSLTERLCPTVLRDPGFSPDASGVPIGGTIVIRVDPAAQSAHSVADGSGLGLFDSGPLPAGVSFSYTLPGAGTYSVIDDPTGHSASIAIRPTVVAARQPESTYVVRWANVPAPSGFVFDVQIHPPNGSFQDWMTGQAGSQATFAPSQGGAYRFRARLRSLSSGATSEWSPSQNVTVP